MRIQNRQDHTKSPRNSFEILFNSLIEAVKEKLNAEFKVVLRPEESSKKLSVLPLRLIVERSFSWLGSFRKIAMYYEFYSDTVVVMVQIAFNKLMLNKIIDKNQNSFLIYRF